MNIRIDSIITDDLDELKEKIIDFFNDLDLEITIEESEE